MKRLEKAGVSVAGEELRPPRTYLLAATDENGDHPRLMCKKAITVDMLWHIRHGNSLTLRGVRWFVTEQAVGEPLLGRPLLWTLGLNCTEMRGAASAGDNGDVDASTILADAADRPVGESTASYQVCSMKRGELTLRIRNMTKVGWTSGKTTS